MSAIALMATTMFMTLLYGSIIDQIMKKKSVEKGVDRSTH